MVNQTALPLRVLHLLDTGGFAGTERLVLSLAKGLTALGVEPVLACRKDSPLHKAAVDRGLEVAPIFGGGVESLLPFKRVDPRLPQFRPVVREIRRRGIDLVHAHNGRTALIAAVARSLTGVPVVTSQHFIHPAFTTYRGPKRWLANAAHAWVNARTSGVMAVSEAARRAVIARENFPADRIVTVPNGIDPPPAPSAEKIAGIRRELNAPAGAPLVVTVARLVAEKGLDEWIDAVAKVKAARPDARFVVVGEGERRASIERRTRRLGVTDVLMLPGFRPDATDYIAAADLFVLPSPAEPFGLVLLEAMAHGKPVVACRAGGPVEIVTDGADGSLVAPGSAEELAGAVVKLLDDSELRRRQGEAGRRAFAGRFTVEQMSRLTLALYRRAVGAGASDGARARIRYTGIGAGRGGSVTRVLLISHTCMSRTEGQPKAELLGRMPGIQLRVVVPDRWSYYGLEWRTAEAPPAGASFEYEVKKVALPWVGRAQWHMHWYPTLGETIRAFMPDVIDIWEESWMFVSGHAVRLRNRLAPRAKVVTETEQNLEKKLPLPFERLRAYTLRHADCAVARSRGAAAVLRAKGFTRPIDVVPNAVDAELFRPSDGATRAAVRRDLGFEGFVAGYVGRLVEEKGLTDLIDALSRCGPAVRIAFVGSGPMRDELQRRAAATGVAGRVSFLPARPLAELPGVMGALDALVLASRTRPNWKEQFGRVIIEAHACGVPVVGSDSGAIPDVIGAGGLVFPEGDAAALAAALDGLAADPAAARRMGEAGRDQVERHYTWRRVAEKMREVYAKALGRPEWGDAHPEPSGAPDRAFPARATTAARE